MAFATRDYIRLNLMGIPFELKELVLKVPGDSQFAKRHGYLLRLVTSQLEEDMMRVLCQFFDLEHRCFTFLDYQLVATLEEFSDLLGIPISDHLPFTGLESTPKPETIVALHLK